MLFVSVTSLVLFSLKAPCTYPILQSTKKLEELSEGDQNSELFVAAYSVFKQFDTNKNGLLNEEQFTKLVTEVYKSYNLPTPSDEDSKSAFPKADINHDGLIAFDGFRRWFQLIFFRYDESTTEEPWIATQKKTFTRWCNSLLIARMKRVNDLFTDFKDGTLLINLLEIVSKQSLGKYHSVTQTYYQKLANCDTAIRFIREQQNIRLVGIGPEDIVEGRKTLILGLIWTLIVHYQLSKGGSEFEGTVKKDILGWINKQLEPYDVRCDNFTTSWQDGKVLSALVDSLSPGLMCKSPKDIGSLTGPQVKDVNQAMELASKEFGIPRILDPEDMVNIPDEMAILTYISYFRDTWANMQEEAQATKRKSEIEMREKQTFQLKQEAEKKKKGGRKKKKKRGGKKKKKNKRQNKKEKKKSEQIEKKLSS